MDPQLLAQIERFDPSVPIEAAWMPPSTWYTDPGIYELERRAVFQRSWQPVARVSQLGEPGAYVSGCLAGEPWVVVRGETGELHAFHNVCRHKGREVVTGDGVADALVCGYHAWRYGLDGRLQKAPRMAGVTDFEKGEMSLRPLAVATWGPWVFVHGDPNAPALASTVGELDARLEKSGWDDLVFHSQKSWTIGCNWKVYIDNYLDGGYHIPHMHPSLDAQIDMASYRTEIFERFSVQTTEPTGGEAGALDFDPADRIGPGATYAWVFPNFMLNRYGPCLDTNFVVPLSADQCRVEYQFYFSRAVMDGPRDFIETSIAQADVTQREDIEICESVQVGLKSSAYDRGRYAPQVEVGEHHFHRLLAEAIRSHL